MTVRLAVTLGVVLVLAGVLLWWLAGRDSARGSDLGPIIDRPLAGPTIIITKAERKLRFYSQGRLVATYAIGLGGSPTGHKQREGDSRTPEGDYYVCVKNPRSRFYLSLGISYPGKSDAARGLADGSISRAQHDAIVAAIDGGRTPPWNTPLGGEIMIHGHGSGSDWTRGCIALDDADIKSLYEQVSVGTAVQIKP